MLRGSFPDEVISLERSVRTLDLTHNKLGIAQISQASDSYLSSHFSIVAVQIPMEINKLINLQRLVSTTDYIFGTYLVSQQSHFSV
ncbi:hypothetical protein MTR67_051484 [Solanum verrucosum]|uniref:Uncharacterized protein n=1 Tax=Solanum verrucosum TaxID=315347 RepID=A0AAF1A2S6_SOLVR|nr:hypothetical protein MTR67_051484 [Solanum verrucosum]